MQVTCRDSHGENDLSNAQTQFHSSFLQLHKNFANKMILTCLFLCVSAEFTFQSQKSFRNYEEPQEYDLDF